MIIQANSNDIVVIFLSIIFPLILTWEGEIEKKINVSIWQIFRYLNKEKLNESENYFRWYRLLIPNQKEMIKFLVCELEINDTNPLLLPGRSGEENDLIRHFQSEVKKSYKIKKGLILGKYIIPIIIINLLLFTS